MRLLYRLTHMLDQAINIIYRANIILVADLDCSTRKQLPDRSFAHDKSLLPKYITIGRCMCGISLIVNLNYSICVHANAHTRPLIYSILNVLLGQTMTFSVEIFSIENIIISYHFDFIFLWKKNY